MSGSDVDNVENVRCSPPPPCPDFSLSQHTPGARITCELLNGKNFAAWSHSVRLFLGGKGKSGWLLGTITKPNATDPKFVQWEIDNCTILGWLFNSMEPRIYHLFMYHDMASQASLSLFVADYFAYLQSRWEELAPNLRLFALRLSTPLPCRPSLRPLLCLTVMSAAIAFYNYLLHLSQSPPFLIRWLLLLLVPVSLVAALSSGRAPCSFCGGVTHGRDRCFKLHPELRETFKRNKEKSKASPRIAAISETSYGSPAAPTAPDLHQLQTQFQNQIEQLQLQFQTQLGSLMQQSPRPNPSPSTATIASSIPTALHVRSSNPSWVFDSGADDHMTGELSLFTSHLSSIDQFVRIADGSIVHVRSKGEICLSSQLTLSAVLYVPDFAYNLLSDQNSKKIFGRGYEWNGLYYFGDPPDSLPSISLQASVLPSLESMTFSLTSLKLWHARLGHANFQYLCTPHSLNPRQGEAPEDPSIFSRPVPLFESPQVASPTLPPVLTSDPRHMYSRRPPASDPLPAIFSRICMFSYQGLSDSYRTFIGHVSSISDTRSVSEALRDPNWVTAMQVPGQDYGATFATVAKLTTVRVIISLAASYSWPLHQLDVKNAFLNGDLHETIYMDPPLGVSG
ncbi:hypothetical protein Acr_27g0003560 [Actinidia rufa]|uniref:Uncharacterized protein n=1 Tax=Actinidia rufa TaxID=165716 RepID=A0A7J0H685_9ERIC|nr:hypothetical protein Acr_27g0003560 [Actinidia rufa]